MATLLTGKPKRLALRELLPPKGGRKERMQAELAKAAIDQFDYPTTQVGVVGNVTVYYDPALGAAGLSLAKQMLNSVSGPYNDMERFFGIAGGTVNLVIAPLSGNNDGSGGAYHYGCDFTSGGTLYCDATFASTTVSPLSLEIALYIAELSESFMGAQGKGWGCGFSNGEGLSRFCAEQETSMATLSAYATGPSWAAAGFPDWVTTTEQTDGNAISTGCAIVYIYWMRSLGYTIPQIVQAGGATLAANYQTLTGKTTAYQDLLAAVQNLSITSDNPFTQPGADLWHTIRNANGTWQAQFGLVEGQSAGGPSSFVGIAAGSADTLSVQIVGLGTDNQLWHTIRFPNGTWQAAFGLIESQSSGGPTSFTAGSCAGAGQALQVMGLGSDGQLWHTIRNPDGTWQAEFGLVESQSTGGPPAFVAITCGSADDQSLQVVGVGTDDNLWHTIRNPDGTWQPEFGLVESQSAGGPANFVAVSAAGAGLALHVVGLGNNGSLWHTIRNADGTWQPAFGLIESQSAGGASNFAAVACGSADGQALQVVALGNDGNLWHTVRFPDGTWQANFGLIESQSGGGPPAFDAVSCAGAGQALQVAGVGTQ
jgi:hypothetical protein